MKWPIVEIETADGRRQAAAPSVISASRSTDIPAFHAAWFFNRLRAGYCKWLNPFNGQTVYVSLSRTRAFVFWTKNAAPILPLLPELDRRGLAYYFQFTVNDYEAEGLEPHVPPLAERIATFRQLAQTLGKHRVIWRYDPLLLTDTLSVDTLLAKLERIGRELHPCTEKLVFSFADIAGYPRVRRNLEQAGVPFREFTPAAMHDFAAGLVPLLNRWGLAACTCAETVDLTPYGIGHNRCIDAELLLRIAHNDAELRRAFHAEVELNLDALKDRGQRKACGCAVSKDIGQYNTCPHLCRYCYANASLQLVEANQQRFATDAESILRASEL
jgi:hypothetical protein